MSDSEEKMQAGMPDFPMESAKNKMIRTVLLILCIICAISTVAIPILSVVISRDKRQKKQTNENQERCEALLEQYYGIPKEIANVQVKSVLSDYIRFSFRAQNKTYEGYVNHGVMETTLFVEDLEQEVGNQTEIALVRFLSILLNNGYIVHESDIDVPSRLPAWITKDEIEKYLRGESEHQEEWEKIKITCYISVVSREGVELKKEDFSALREKIPFLNTLTIGCFRYEDKEKNKWSENAYKQFTYNPTEDSLATVIRPSK